MNFCLTTDPEHCIAVFAGNSIPSLLAFERHYLECTRGVGVSGVEGRRKLMIGVRVEERERQIEVMQVM